MSSQNFSFIGLYLPELLLQKTPNWAQLGPESPKKQWFQESKVKKHKYPEVKICGSRNYGWMVLLRTI